MSEAGWTTEPVPPQEEPEDAPTVDTDQPKGTLYHYTGPAGLIGIVDSREDAKGARELTFFASDLLQMNDRSELSFGLRLIKEQVSSHPPAPGHEPFRQRWERVLENYLSSPTVEALKLMRRPCVSAVSFTTDRDLLSQWVTYGSGGGFAIGLDAKTLRRSTHAATVNGQKVEQGSVLFRVRYGDQARAYVRDGLGLSKEGMEALQRVAESQDGICQGV